MMNSPLFQQAQALRFRSLETDRITEQNDRNLLRLIAHNNRRIRAGLRPLDIPPGLQGK